MNILHNHIDNLTKLYMSKHTTLLKRVIVKKLKVYCKFIKIY
jgi:hypothetical protein